jgi:NADPH:quinone reductase-like Zn-dependent oxidoreductase
MHAVGYQQSLAITDETSLTDIELPRPEPGARDLLVEIKAVSVNPVDTKVRMRAAPEPGAYKVLGYDASGVVRAVGSEFRCSSQATRCSMQAPSPAQAPMPNFIWWMSGSWAQSPNP